MLNAVDGSEDHLIKVPGVEDYDLGEGDDEDGDSSDSESDLERDSDEELTDSEIEVLIWTDLGCTQ